MCVVMFYLTVPYLGGLEDKGWLPAGPSSLVSISQGPMDTFYRTQTHNSLNIMVWFTTYVYKWDVFLVWVFVQC